MMAIYQPQRISGNAGFLSQKFTGAIDGTAPGATLSGTSSIAPGSASGGGTGDATALGTSLSGLSGILAGSASNGSYARAPSGSGPIVIPPGSIRPPQSATSRPSNTGGRRY